MNKIAILTSGGDAPGMNAAIRAITRVASKKQIEVYGVQDGYAGLVQGQIKRLKNSDVSEVLSRGGTILGSSRLPEFVEETVQLQAVHQLQKRGIEGLIVIGGDGSYRGALELSQKGICCIGVPGTIDNDINGTDETIGFHTALYNIVDAVNKLRDTSSSHHRCFVIEVMGNNRDSLALYSGIACGSEFIITKNTGYDEDYIVKMMDFYEKEQGKKHAIIIASENMIDVEKLAERISKETHFSGRSIVLGHIQRGGSPVPQDRILASQMGQYAVELLIEHQSGYCVCKKDNHIIARKIDEALNDVNKIQEKMYQLFNELV
ncbi:6-phosphofructokinase [Candidatus Stoquefichus sp. SB1]|uniref:6-phosphofructokinase n=1 Tax=Candidatus Stoquefichus sp. SB1 TaxID=1658109 RepID=UPI00067F0615|nr:6-phosphofructokinase [Candidatus Stoquefichus sp. SB1]